MAFITHWRNSHQPNYRSLYKEAHGEAAYKDAIAQAMRDEEIMAVPGLREALLNPEGTNARSSISCCIPDGPFWREHSAQDTKATIPAISAPAGATTVCPARRLYGWRDWQGPKRW